MKIVKLAVLFVLLNTFINSVYAEKIKVLAFNYPPFFSEKSIGEFGNGYWYDIMVLSFKEVGVEVETTFRPLARARKEFLGKKHRLLLGSKIPPKNSQEAFIFGYFKIYVNYFKSYYHDGIQFKKLTDLKKYKVGVLRGTPLASLYKKVGLNIDMTNSNDSLAKKLYRKRIDIWPSTFLSARYMIAKYFPESVNDFVRSNNSIFTGTIGLIYMKGDDETRKTVERFAIGLKAIKKNGLYLKTVQKYWGNVEVPKEILTY